MCAQTLLCSQVNDESNNIYLLHIFIAEDPLIGIVTLCLAMTQLSSNSA